MRNKEKDAQKPKRRIPKLVMLSVSIGILGLLILPFATVVHYPHHLRISFRNVVGVLGALSLLFGVVAFIRMSRYKWALMWSFFAIIGIVLAILTLGFWLKETYHKRSVCIWSPASHNLRQLADAMFVYGNDNNGHYPEPNRWCDLLQKSDHVTIEHFVCPSFGLRWPYRRGNWPWGLGNWPSKGRGLPAAPWTVFTWPFPRSRRCHFAMNPDCRSDSAEDTVALFEAEEGWNQVGGLEMALVELRKKDRIRVVLKDCDVRIVNAESIAKLNWGGE